MTKKVKWKDLFDFIQNQLEKDPNFLENNLMIECVSPEQVKPESGWEIIQDSEGWVYTEPAWRHGVLTTTITDQSDESEKTVTLNINY